MSKKVQRPIIDVKVDFGDKGWGDLILSVIPIYGDLPKSKVPAKPKYGTTAYWEWVYKYGAEGTGKSESYILQGYESRENTCCAFFVLGDWVIKEPLNTKGVKELVAAKMADVLKKRNKYYSTYLPDQKKYAGLRDILLQAGFQQGMRQKSSHGKYTVSRLEYIPTGEKLEEIIRSLSA